MQAKRAYLANPDFPPVEIVRQRVGTPTRCFWFSNNFNGGFDVEHAKIFVCIQWIGMNLFESLACRQDNESDNAEKPK